MMDMKITKLCEYLAGKWMHHTKHNHLSSELKSLVYQARNEKASTMSKRKFWSYLEKYGIGWSTLRGIITKWESYTKEWDNPLVLETWSDWKTETYTERYHHTSRIKKVDTLTPKQKAYVINFRTSNPNAWYKRFYNKLLQPEYLDTYKGIFGSTELISKEDYYAILNEANIKKRITKRQKQSFIQKQYKNAGGIKAYCAKMKYVYLNEKALHKRQVDIKYTIDIPNMLITELAFLCPYQITFRDFKSWAVILFYGRNRDTSRVMVATQIFGTILQQAGVYLKDVELQFDWWAEFSTVKINGTEGKYLEYLKKNFRWYKIIDRKEHNGHVEAYHRICEEDFMDTDEVRRDMKGKSHIEKKELFLERTHKYVKNHNKYWFSSYRPRYEVFKKKSPNQIIIDDRGIKLNQYVLETYFWAYDVDGWISLPRKNTYKTLINSIINTNINQALIPYHAPATEELKSGQVWARLYKNLILSQTNFTENGTM